MARTVIAALATAWGPRFGGINAFNTELVKSLGILPERDYDLVCVVPGAATQQEIEEGRRFGVDVRGIDGAAAIVRDLGADAESERFVWIGHDDKTSPLALELRRLAPGSRAVLINHMAFGAYQSVKKGDSASAATKEAAQRELFRNADLCFAVGPMLCSHLRDLLGTSKKRPPVEMLVPGLAEPTDYNVEMRDAPPENYVAFVAGRLDAEDDRIKQGRLALRAFGQAVGEAGEHSAIRRSPKLRMRGVRASEQQPLRDLLTEEAQGAVAFDFQDYTEDRTAYFGDLSSASVAMMPSWHEGFGLTAWEAIASAVPVVVGEQSGVYRLLNEDCSGAGLGHSVTAVQIAGWVPSSEDEPNHTEEDVARVADALLGFGERGSAAKQDAITLRRMLVTLGYDWKGCALSFVEKTAKHLGIALTAQREAAAPPPAPTPAPTDLTIPEPLRVPEPRPWNRTLGFPTSLLLVARDEVVRFDPEREPILSRMLEWTSSAPPLAARLLFAPGGMGKTRLALELARRLQPGWASIWVPATPPEDWTSVLHQRGRPALVVIDYADARPAAALDAVGAAIESLRGGNASPVRVLLLARSESWLATLAQHPSCTQEVADWLSMPVAVEPVQLPPWSSDESTRRASYDAALEDYAAAIGIAPPPNAYVPPLGEKIFEWPLYLHLAALAALEGERPESAEALLRSQLQREWRYWCRVHGEQLTSYDNWADALAYVVLRQGAAESNLPAALAAALQRSYSGGAGSIAPLEPDLLAEAVLRERLAAGRGTEILDRALGDDPEQPPPGIAVLARLATHPRAFDREGVPAAWAAVLIAGIARHWPRHPNTWLAAAHRAEFGLGRMLDTAWQQLDDSVRTSLAAALDFPEYSTNLLDVTVAAYRQRVSAAHEHEEKAAALHNLSVALSDRRDATSRTEALAAVREAVRIFRQLAQTQPAAHLPNLALSLNNLGIRLSEQGDADSRAEALATAREAIGIRRQLAQTQPAAYLPALAMSLNNITIHLSEQGDADSRTEALASVREAVRIYRQLAQTQPAAHLNRLASSLENLGIRLFEQGNADSHAEALAAVRETVRIRRQLAQTQPAAYLPALASSLNHLGNHLSERGDSDSHAEALAAAREAVRIYRQLSQTQPAAYLPALALSLNNLGHHVSEQDDSDSRAEALAATREAVRIYCQLAQTQPAAYLPALAMALNNLGVRLSEQGDSDSGAEALAATREAVRIRRQLAQTQPAAYLPSLASVLNNLGVCLSEQDDPDSRAEALAAAREAVRIYARFHASMPTAFERNLGVAVASLRLRATENGQDPDDEVRTALEAAMEDAGPTHGGM